MPTGPTQRRALTDTLRHLPSICRELIVVARDHRLLVDRVARDQARLAEALERVDRLENVVQGLGESVDRMHETLVESDPAMALQIVTSVRDDVRSLLVTVAEQANTVRDGLSAAPTLRGS